jgi:3-keto-5-aminohexanoate cleavage enzyme
MSAHDAHYAGEIVDGARVLRLFGDVATEMLIRLDGDEGHLQGYESVEFLAPVFTGDFLEVTCELAALGKTSRKLLFEARKVVANTRGPGLAPSAADVLLPPVIVARAIGNAVVPVGLQRRPPELYPPGLPPGPPPSADAIVTPSDPDAPDVVLAAALVELTRATSARDVADEAARCREAGAAVIHLRDSREEGTPADRFAEIVEAIRGACDCILQPSTGGAAGMSVDERVGPLASRPEMAALRCGTINAGDEVLVSSRADIRRIAARIQAAGAVPELECYEVGHVAEALSLPAEGILHGMLHFQFVLGVRGAIPAREDVVGWMKSMVPAGSTWSVAPVGRLQQPITEVALRLGGHVRVGFDGSAWGRGQPAEGAAQLVARAASYARSIGRQPVSPARARPILGLTGPSVAPPKPGA